MIKREIYLSQLRELKDIQIIKVVVGVRRCGKSTLLELFRDELLLEGVPVSTRIIIRFASQCAKKVRANGNFLHL